MNRTNEYRFYVERAWEWDYTGVAEDAKPLKKIFTNYEVSLPHSCNSWVITEEVDKPEAIKKMEQFIKEAKDALNKLKAL